MEKGIIVGVDETDRSMVALDAAATEAALRGRRLRVLHGDPFAQPFVVTVDQRPPASVSWILNRAVTRARAVEPAVEVEGELARSFPQKALIGASKDAELVVIGDRGLNALQRAFVDTIAGGLASHARCPVMVVRGDPEPGGPIVLGVDGSAAGEAAVGFAFAEADLRGCELVAVHAWSRPVAHDASRHHPVVFDADAIRAGADRLVSEALAGWREKYPDVRVRHLLDHGHPRQVLIDAGAGADLMVVGARGHGMRTDLGLGTVSAHLLYHAPVSMVVVPQR